MEQRISLITLGVADLKKSRAFYDALGWQAAGADDGETIVCYNLTGMALALHPWPMLAEDAGVPAGARGGRSGFAIAHNVRAKEDVAALLQQAEQCGGEIARPAQDTFWGGHSGYFSDPDGYLWEVAYNPFSPLGPNGEFQWDCAA